MPIASTTQFGVNTNLTGDQFDPVSLRLESGDLVVAWRDANANTIVYRVQSPSGTWGSQVTLATSQDHAGDLSITQAAHGGFHLVWKKGMTSASDTDIFGASVGADGTVITGPVNLTTSGAQEINPTVHKLADGSVALVTADNATSHTLSLRIFNSNLGGTPTAITIQAGADVDAARTSVVNLSDGNFVVFYQKGISGSTEIVGRVFDGTGTAVSTDFTVNTTTAGNQANPFAMQMTNGQLFVAWHEGTSITGRIFSADLTTATTEIAINTTVGTAASNVHMVQLADSRIAVVWQSTESGSSEIRARLYSMTGAALSTDFVVNSTLTGDQILSKVTANDDGRFTVSWQSNDTDGGEAGQGVRTAVFDPRQFFGGSGADQWGGGDWSELMYGAGGNDSLSGNGGDDVLNGNAGDDTLAGGIGNDRLVGGDGNDNLDGGDGNDRVWGGNGTDTLIGGAGDDFMSGGAGSDTFDCGSGTDTVSYYDEGAVVINMSVTGNTAGVTLMNGAALGDVFLSAGKPENIIGSSVGGDTITGSTSGNRLFGFGGVDTLNGNGGNDFLYGGNGADTLNGDLGDDNLFGDAGNDTLNGGDGNDVLHHSVGSDTYDGGLGLLDTLTFFVATTGATFSLDGTISVGGAAAGDVITANTIENAYGSNATASGDSITGSASNNLLRGYAGNDLLIGKNGADTLEGGDGDDRMEGGAGIDKLVGGTGNDTYVGGADSDTFLYDAYGNETYLYEASTDGGATGDIINSFNLGDTMAFKSSAFGSLTVETDLSASRFVNINNSAALTGADISTNATTTSVRFVYNQFDDKLWYDADGTGATAAVLIAKFVPTRTNLVNTDLAIVS